MCYRVDYVNVFLIAVMCCFDRVMRLNLFTGCIQDLISASRIVDFIRKESLCCQ